MKYKILNMVNYDGCEDSLDDLNKIAKVDRKLNIYPQSKKTNPNFLFLAKYLVISITSSWVKFCSGESIFKFNFSIA